jgi:hypothetical protein
MTEGQQFLVVGIAADAGTRQHRDAVKRDDAGAATEFGGFFEDRYGPGGPFFLYLEGGVEARYASTDDDDIMHTGESTVG